MTVKRTMCSRSVSAYSKLSRNRFIRLLPGTECLHRCHRDALDKTEVTIIRNQPGLPESERNQTFNPKQEKDDE